MASNATQYCCYAGGEVRGVGVGWNLVTSTGTVCVYVSVCARMVCVCGVGRACAHVCVGVGDCAIPIM